MSDAKHTPGPWSIKPPTRDSLYDIIGADKSLICCPLEKEDAHLIAAAPELLEVCKDALDTIQDWNPSAARPIETVLKRAIAKAEGQQ